MQDASFVDTPNFLVVRYLVTKYIVPKKKDVLISFKTKTSVVTVDYVKTTFIALLAIHAVRFRCVQGNKG
jgi:hypothetical protein